MRAWQSGFGFGLQSQFYKPADGFGVRSQISVFPCHSWIVACHSGSGLPFSASWRCSPRNRSAGRALLRSEFSERVIFCGRAWKARGSADRQIINPLGRNARELQRVAAVENSSAGTLQYRSPREFGDDLSRQDVGYKRQLSDEICPCSNVSRRLAMMLICPKCKAASVGLTSADR